MFRNIENAICEKTNKQELFNLKKRKQEIYLLQMWKKEIYFFFSASTAKQVQAKQQQKFSTVFFLLEIEALRHITWLSQI